MKKNLKPLQLVTEDSIRDHRAAVVKDLEKRLYLRDDAFSHGQQVRTLTNLNVCVLLRSSDQALLHQHINA